MRKLCLLALLLIAGIGIASVSGGSSQSSAQTPLSVNATDPGGNAPAVGTNTATNIGANHADRATPNVAPDITVNFTDDAGQTNVTTITTDQVATSNAIITTTAQVKDGAVLATSVATTAANATITAEEAKTTTLSTNRAEVRTPKLVVSTTTIQGNAAEVEKDATAAVAQ